MEASVLQDIRDSLQGHFLSCQENGEELERSPYTLTTGLNLKGLPCLGKETHRALYQQDPRKYSRRFIEECKMMSRLAHPNILQFLGVYITRNHTPAMVTEQLALTLGSALDDSPTLPDHASKRILEDVALALRFLHERNEPIVHRDLNASNIVLTESNRAKISDLGMAKIAEMTISKASRLTKVPGTLCYMAPEVLISNPRFEASCNVFSYGVLILHVLSGQWPTPTEATMLDANDRLIPVSEWDRRQEFAEDLATSSEEMVELAKYCLCNNSTQRPKIADVWETVCQANLGGERKQGAKVSLTTNKKTTKSSTSLNLPAKSSSFKSSVGPSLRDSFHAKSRPNFENRPSSVGGAMNYENQPPATWGPASSDQSGRTPFNLRNRSSPDSSIQERESKAPPTIPERGQSTVSTSVSDKFHQPPPPVAEKSKPSSSASPSTKAKPSHSSVERGNSFRDKKEAPSTGNGFSSPASAPAVKEAKDTPKVGRLSSNFSSMFEEKREKEKKPEDESNSRPVTRMNSNVGDVNQLKKVFAMTLSNNQQNTPADLPRAAPKPTKSSRWRSQQEVESEIMATKAATTGSRVSGVVSGGRTSTMATIEDNVEEIYDSYVDMTPQVLEEESKVRIFAKVVYDYEADDEDELSIAEGETVEVVDIQEHDDQPQWWLVRKGEAFGNIPSTYVQLIKNPQGHTPKTPAMKNTPSTSSTPGRDRNPARDSWQNPTTVAPQSNQRSDSPSFMRSKGPSGTGGDTVNRRGGGTGAGARLGAGKSSQRASIFVNLEDFKSRRKTVEALFGPQTSTVTATPTPQAAPIATPKPAQPTPQYYVALYDFSPSTKDEISFIAGDYVMDAYDLCEGWLIGTIVRTGQRGNVPKTYFRIT